MLLPLFLRLAGKDVLVVGAGNVAERKIADLVEAGAHVRVVARAAAESVQQLGSAGKLSLLLREFAEADVDGAWLVIAATADADTQKRVCAAADRARIFAVAIDDPPNGSAISASVIRRDPFTIAISSSGAAPALSRLLREILEQVLPDQDWVEAAAKLREKWRAEKTPMAERFPELVRAFKARAGS